MCINIYGIRDIVMLCYGKGVSLLFLNVLSPRKGGRVPECVHVKHNFDILNIEINIILE